MSARGWWQVARVPVLLGLLVGVGHFQAELAAATAQLDVDRSRMPWFAIVLIGVAFVVIALAARRHGPVRVTSAIEVGIAALLVFITPIFMWLEFSPTQVWPGLAWLRGWIGAPAGNMFMQGLAVAWLVIAARSLVVGGDQRSWDAREPQDPAPLERQRQ